MSEDAIPNKANLITGIVVLAVALLIVAFAIIRSLPDSGVQPGVMYVAYFENSGGIQEGDDVRIQGRRAGVVKSVGVVMRDGKAVTRVEFEIKPGSGSQWLKDAPIPGDSTISVKTPSFMGRPQLLISIGSKDDDPIAEGGEWTKTRSAGSKDQLTEWHDDLVRAQDEIERFVSFFDDTEGFERLKNQLGDIAEALEKADQQIADLTENAGETGDKLDEAKQQLDDLHENLASQSEPASDALGQIADNTSQLPAELDKIDERIGSVLDEVERMKSDSSGMASTAEQMKLDQLGIELRKMAARLRSSMERAVYDPSQAGDMPNWRRTRPYFNGGTPSKGTSIDENPPPAPADQSGVPKGVQDQKRVK
ncbi:MAG: MCE family protein [Planctomycetes bacterium]|nr:MCE family protein [Planctomycetota bacterium]